MFRIIRRNNSKTILDLLITDKKAEEVKTFATQSPVYVIQPKSVEEIKPTISTPTEVAIQKPVVQVDSSNEINSRSY